MVDCPERGRAGRRMEGKPGAGREGGQMNYFKKKKAPLAGEAKRVLLAAGVCACLGDMAA